MKKIFRFLLQFTPTILNNLRAIRDLNKLNSKSQITPWGFTLCGNKLMSSGNFEKEETNLILDLLKDVDVFINIGANIGYYCCHALNMGKEVIAVEPMSNNVHYLLRNINENDWANNAQVFPIALGDKPGVLKIFGSGTGASLIKGWASIPENFFTQVPINTLDNIIGEKIVEKKSLILMDVEGYEYFVLNGATKILSNTPSPIWIVEITSTELQPNFINPNFIQTFQIFQKNGYNSYSANLNKDSFNFSEINVKDITKTKLSDNSNYMFIKP